jgi:anaerobic dimethyl sulfoxide reductase subunit C (anchor subunit)
MLKEWPLVAFTILGQTAVGASLVLFLLLLPAEAGWSERLRGRVLATMGVTIGLLLGAAALSFFHLRHPVRARRVLANLRTSWLSREILFEIAFTGLVALAFVLVWTRNAETLLFKAVTGSAALMGMMFLVSMSKLYMLGSLPPWNQAYTGISFVLTAGTLGGMGAAWLLGISPGRPFPSFLWAIALVCLLGDIWFATLLTPRYGIAGFRLEPSLRPPPRETRLLHLVRLAFLAGGLFSSVLAMARGFETSGESARPLMIFAFVLVLLGEIVGRFLFYGLVPRPGD